MQALKQFSLPILEMKIGVKEYQYVLDNAFFQEFENKMVTEGQLEVVLEVDKKHDHFILEFSFDGTVLTECDRCTDPINYPLNSEHTFILQYDDEPREEEEIIYIAHDETEYNCAQLFYEQVILNLPMLKTCDEVDNKECDPGVLAKLNSEDRREKIEGENPFSEALKNLKL